MKHVRLVPALLSAVMLAACTTAPAPNDSASRALNEMKAVPRPIPPKPDPRDLKIADLERQKADLEAELAKLRSSSAADLDQAKARINELENQLSQRDRELAGLRSAVGDKDRLASQLSDADRQLSAKDQELARLHPAEQEARVARAEAVVEANAATLLKAQAGVEKARAVLAEREGANRRLQDLARKDVASVQRAEEAQRDEDVARAELALVGDERYRGLDLARRIIGGEQVRAAGTIEELAEKAGIDPAGLKAEVADITFKPLNDSELAAWTMTASLLLNLDETQTQH